MIETEFKRVVESACAQYLTDSETLTAIEVEFFRQQAELWASLQLKSDQVQPHPETTLKQFEPYLDTESSPALEHRQFNLDTNPSGISIWVHAREHKLTALEPRWVERELTPNQPEKAMPRHELRIGDPIESVDVVYTCLCGEQFHQRDDAVKHLKTATDLFPSRGFEPVHITAEAE